MGGSGERGQRECKWGYPAPRIFIKGLQWARLPLSLGAAVIVEDPSSILLGSRDSEETELANL